MSDTEPEVRARLNWVKLYEQTQDAGLTCLRCGISRPTLRKWWRRYQKGGQEALCSQSRQRKNPPQKKLTPQRETTILELRQKRKLGPKSLQSELEREHQLKLSTATLWKVLHDNQVACLRKPRVPEPPLRYSRPVPGDRVQMDTCQVGPRLYQFTAVDDCTRLRVLGVYCARTAANAVDFLVERMLQEFPFPIQRIQTDRGSEFFGFAFQYALREHCIKFRPNRPAAPHLNGKVERSQQTDKIEFWATADLASADLPLRLSEWQHYYNWLRPHTSLNGITPMQYFFSLLEKTPWSEEVEQKYDPAQEPFRDSNYQLDKQMKTLMKQRTDAQTKRADIETM